MRKISCIILSLMLLATVFMGCRESDEPLAKDDLPESSALTIRICGYSDSVPESPHELEFSDWSQDRYNDSKAEKEVTVTVGNENVTGSYVESEKRLCEFYVTHRYTDEEDRSFSLTEDGKLSRYFFGTNSSQGESEQTYNEQQCIDMASDFIADITDVSQYTITAEFDQDRGMYTISFAKYADGFKCSDCAEIMIEETGYIYSFSSTMLGRVPADAVTDFDKEDVKNQIISKLDEEYSQARQSYDKVTYDIDYELTVDDKGEYALLCIVDVDCVDSYDGYDTTISERILLLVQQ